MRLLVRKRNLVELLWIPASILFAVLISVVIFDLRQAASGSDIHNYIRLYNRYSEYLQDNATSYLTYISSEIGFHYLYESLSIFLDDPELALRLISSFSAAIIFYICMKGSGSWAIIIALLLIHPRTLDFLSSQQRMALAISFMLLAWKTFPRLAYLVATFAASTIHTYMMVIGSSLLVFAKVSNIDSARRRRRAFILSIMLISLITVAAQPVILSIIGDRRAEGNQQTFGILYLIMWVAFYATVLFCYPRIFTNEFGFLFSIMAVSAIIANLIGLYSERYVVLSIIFLSMANLQVSSGKLQLLTAVLIPNLFLSFMFWIRFNI